jgi:hypothetical protein
VTMVEMAASFDKPVPVNAVYSLSGFRCELIPNSNPQQYRVHTNLETLGDAEKQPKILCSGQGRIVVERVTKMDCSL